MTLAKRIERAESTAKVAGARPWLHMLDDVKLPGAPCGRCSGEGVVCRACGVVSPWCDRHGLWNGVECPDCHGELDDARREAAEAHAGRLFAAIGEERLRRSMSEPQASALAMAIADALGPLFAQLGTGEMRVLTGEWKAEDGGG